MSSIRSQLESSIFQAAGLDISNTADGDSEHSLMPPSSAPLSASIQVYPLDTAADDGSHPAIESHDMIDGSHFEDFGFAYQGLADQEAMISLAGDAKFEEHAPGVFQAAHRPSVSSVNGGPESAPSQVGSFRGPSAGRRRQSMDISDDDSEESAHGGSNSLEDSVADEFGLSSRGPGDGTDFGGKSKDDKSDAAPAWSELKTKAGKERKRLPLACIACRRKKIRCSGEKPACKHCLRSRIPCVYKVTTRKAAPRTDYMAMLDKRLKRMEERIIKIVPKTEGDGPATTVTRAVVKPAIPGTVPTSKAAGKKRVADEAFGPDLDHWARAPSKGKNDGSSKPTSLQIQEAEENKLFLEGLDALPDKDIQVHLAEVFFENIYGQAYHLLHKPSYMRKLEAGALPPVLILSVCAVAARFSTHPELNTSPNFLRGEEWASHARDICTKRYEWPNITILTCLLILGLHEFGTCHGGRSWALGGQAIRMAFALQLHKDLEYDPQRQIGASQLSFIDREIRRRTMWACFLMDRFNSSGTDRPMFVKEETIKIPLPIKEKYFQLDMPAPTETLDGKVPRVDSPEDEQLADAKDNMGVAAYMVRVIALWGRIISYLNQQGKEMDSHPIWSPESQYAKLLKEAEEITTTLPEPLRYSADNLQLHDTENMANQFLFLHIAIQQNILFMNRVAAMASPGASSQEVPKAFVTKAGSKMFAAANRISDLLKDAEPYIVAAPFVGYCAFSSSTVHIFGIFSRNPTLEAASKRNLATNVKFLSKMKRYWGMFHWMSENLREQYRTCADTARQGGPANEGATTSPIFQYGDWFDRYPHGVSHTDFIDPASYKKKEKGDDAVLEQKPELHTVEEFFTTLSPPQSAETREGQRPNAMKRKSFVGKKPGGATKGEQQQLEPLMTDFSAPSASEQLSARLQQQRRFSGALGGPASGPASFNPLTIPHSQAGNSYHALSPISPVAVSQFGHHHHGPTAFYSPDLLSLQLSQQANGILQPLDRQLVFGAYSMEQGGMGSQQSMLDGVSEWDGIPGHTHRVQGGHGGDGSRARLRARSSMNGGHGRGHGHQQDSLNSAFGGQEASSAWFMPFNMEPPEITQDMGLGMGTLDAFGNMFGGGMATPGGNLGGLHHAGR